MADEEKPGMGVSGAVAGVGTAAVVAGGSGLYANKRRKGKLSDDAKKYIDEGMGKEADAAKEAYAKASSKPTDTHLKDLNGEALTKAKTAHEEALKSWTEGEKKAVDAALKAKEETLMSGLVKNTDKLKSAAEEAAKKAGKAEADIAKAGVEAVAAAEKTAKASFEAAKDIKNASWIKKAPKAVMAMSTGGKIGVGIGAVVAGGIAASIIKGRRQRSWQERMEAEQATQSQQPTR